MEEKSQFSETVVCFPRDESTRVAGEVARAISATGRFSRSHLDVSVSGGVVTLRGRVSSYYEKQMAQTAALTVAGVCQLQNELDVA